MHWALGDIPGSGIREILNLALLRPGTLRLETGEPDFPPAPHIVEAYHRATLDGHNRYTATEGLGPFREALAAKLAKINGVRRKPGDILVTPGGIPGLFLAFVGTCPRGDEVLVPDPGWPDYLGGLLALGIHPVAYPLQTPDYVPDIDTLNRLITPRTRAIVLNFPANPTGALLPHRLVEAVVAWAIQRDLWIISDEVYDQIVFDGHPESPAQLAPERTLSVYSFSKTYAMTGWRLGYLAGPPDAIASLTRVAMGLWSSVSEPLQYAGLAALEGPQTAVQQMCARYRERRQQALASLDAHHVMTTRPQGAFYLLVDISQAHMDARTFALHLLQDQGVAVAPGSAFGRVAAQAVRVSLASDDKVLEQGLERLCTYLAQFPIS